MANKTNWTPQQECAINARGSSIIVSAAAGSGKTAVLTERLAKLIADESAHVRADRIIAVTFTNDAASELRKRLDSKLNRLIAENPSDTYLLKQHTLLQSAKISTINSFCFELLRDNITDQDVTSSFGILDESENKLIKQQAMDELLNVWTSERYEDISFLYDKFCLKDDSGLASVVSALDAHLGSEAFRELWMKKAVALFDAKPEDSICFKRTLSEAVQTLEEALELGNDCMALIDDIFTDPDCANARKLRQRCSDDISRVEQALEIYRSGCIPNDEQRRSIAGFDRLTMARKDVDESAKRIYSAKRKYLVELTRGTLGVLSGFADDFAESGRITRLLCELTEDYHRLIASKKSEKNALSFDDGERLALELLAEVGDDGIIRQSETAKRIAEFYDIIMVDEYQDSNNKQDLIFKLISKNFKADENGVRYGTNAFVVGDAKQSIYGFRLANPKNFINTLGGAEVYSEESTAANRSIFLNMNFRSTHGVIDFVNYLFTIVMDSECGDVDYNENERLYFGAKRYDETEAPVPSKTRFLLIDTLSCPSESDEDVTDEDGVDADSEASVDIEASCIAENIAHMIGEREQVVDGDGTVRDCRSSDFCILIRANRYTSNFVSELKKRGIEAKGEDEKGYLSSREISILLDLLRVIDDPLLDVPLAAVLLSPMYMFSLEELALLKVGTEKSRIYTRMIESAQLGGTPLSAKCASFLEALEDFRLRAVTCSVSELITKIYDMTDFVFVMQMYEDGDKKRANLRALVQYAKSYEEASAADGSGGLTGFIRYIDRIIENGDDFTQGKISTSSGDHVSVKTIHKSKGLEFPFVFLAETSGKFQYDKGSIMCAEEGAVGYTIYSPENVRRHRTAQFRMIRSQKVRDTVSEEMRLLYVALTRAKQRLFINLKFNIATISRVAVLLRKYVIFNGNMKRITAEARSLSDWLWISLMEHSSFEGIVDLLRDKIAEISENDEIQKSLKISKKRIGELLTGLSSFDLPEVKHTDDVFEIVRAEPSRNTAETETVQTLAEADNAVCERLRDMIGFHYDTALSETPAKVSVTQLTKKINENSDISPSLSAPRFMSEKKSLSGAERGTAIHTFFQYCDFEGARTDTPAEIAAVAAQGHITSAQADSIDTANVAAFFESDLYRRISAAERVWRERKFMVSVSDLGQGVEIPELFRESDGMIKGIMDLVFEEDGKLIIVDYKSDMRTSASKLAERYSSQLRLYKVALELITGEKVGAAYLYSFELRRSIEIRV